MSERMSNVGIDDVLSSIRRLVTEDLRPGRGAPAPRLVLTPALRVSPPADPVTGPGTAPAPASAAGPGAAIFPGAAMDLAVAPAAKPVSDADAEATLLERRIADLEAMLAAARPAPAAALYEPEEGDVFSADMPAAWTPAARPSPEVPEAELIDADAMADDLADVEAAPDVWAKARRHAVPQEEAAQAAAPGASLSSESDRVDEDGPLGVFDDGSDLIDEDMLREMVRQILREELQGTMGERITRNVRKLVRAEISRALTTRDFG